MLSILSYFCWSSVCPFCRSVYSVLLPISWFFFFLVFTFITSLYVLDIKLLFDVWVNMSSYAVGYIFILLMVSFAVQKPFSLILFHLLIFFFCFSCPSWYIRKTIKIWKQPKCPSVGEWIKELWNIYTMEYYSAIKKDEILPFAEAWMDLESIMLSTVSQSQRDKYHMISLIFGI